MTAATLPLWYSILLAASVAVAVAAWAAVAYRAAVALRRRWRGRP